MRDRSGLIVLVVEDDPFQRMDLAQGLVGAGCTVVEAGSAEEALSHLRKHRRIDFVVTDINLGGRLNGWDVAESFRAAYPKIPVIYVSGKPAQPERQVPGSVFLHKPCGPADVLKALRPT